MSRAQVAVRTGMNIMTVGRIVENMISRGILQERETEDIPGWFYRSAHAVSEEVFRQGCCPCARTACSAPACFWPGTSSIWGW